MRRAVAGLVGLGLAASALVLTVRATTLPHLPPLRLERWASGSCGSAPATATSSSVSAVLSLPSELASGSTVLGRMRLDAGDDTGEPGELAATETSTLDVLFVQGQRVLGRAATAGTVVEARSVPRPVGGSAELVTHGEVAVAGCPDDSGGREPLPPGDYDAIGIAGGIVSARVPVHVVAAGTAEPLSPPVKDADPVLTYVPEPDGSCAGSPLQVQLDTDYPSYRPGDEATFLATASGGCERPAVDPRLGRITDDAGNSVWDFVCARPVCPDGFTYGFLTAGGDGAEPPDTETASWRLPAGLAPGTYTFEADVLTTDGPEPRYGVRFRVLR